MSVVVRVTQSEKQSASLILSDDTLVAARYCRTG